MNIKKYIAISFAFLITDGPGCTAVSNCVVLPHSGVVLRSFSIQTQKEKISIRISGTTLSINGREILLPIDTTKLFELLGRPDRISRLRNTIFTWDNIGILAYERPNTDQVFQLGIAIGTKRYEFWPSKRFSGVLTIDGARITSQSSFVELNRIKAGRKFVQHSDLTFIWEIRYVDRKISINKGTLDTYDNSGQIIEVVVEILNAQTEYTFAPAMSDFSVTFSAKPTIEDFQVTTLEGDAVEGVRAEFRATDSFQRVEVISLPKGFVRVEVTKDDALKSLRYTQNTMEFRVPSFDGKSAPWGLKPVCVAQK